MAREKYDIVLDVAIVILIVCTLILLYTGYKEFYKKSAPTAIKKPTAPSSLLQKDSLQKRYASSTLLFNNTVLTDSLINFNTEDKQKLLELAQLKEEIAIILKNKNEEADMSVAKIKIDELQIKVAALQAKYLGVAAENSRLQSLLNQLLQANKNTKTNSTAPLQNNTASAQVSIPKNKNIITNKPNNATKPLITQGLYLYAIAINNDKEQETSLADAAEKLVGQFICKATTNNANAEIMVIVLSPNGRLIKNSEWETGSFETTQGKKIYSKKFLVDNLTDDKKLQFSLSPEYFLKGTYIIQIWNSGVLIAKAEKTLS